MVERTKPERTSLVRSCRDRVFSRSCSTIVSSKHIACVPFVISLLGRDCERSRPSTCVLRVWTLNRAVLKERLPCAYDQIGSWEGASRPFPFDAFCFCKFRLVAAAEHVVVQGLKWEHSLNGRCSFFETWPLQGQRSLPAHCAVSSF